MRLQTLGSLSLQSSTSGHSKPLLLLAYYGQLEQVIGLYAGSFVPTLNLEIGIELQEWLYQCREELASRVPQML